MYCEYVKKSNRKTRHEIGGNWNGRMVLVDTNDGKRLETDSSSISLNWHHIHK